MEDSASATAENPCLSCGRVFEVRPIGDGKPGAVTARAAELYQQYCLQA